MTNKLVLNAVTKSYGDTTIISPTSAAIHAGEFVSIIGPSGCGKSTILSMLAGLDVPTSGSISSDGAPITGPSPERGVVFQGHALLPWLTALSNVRFGLRSARPALKRHERESRARAALDAVGLSHAIHRRPAKLSGGMQQRVGIARAFAIEPEVLLLDEPFGALDALTRRDLQRQLAELWNTSKNTVVMVTHDVDEAITLSDRILVMGPPPSTIIEDITVASFEGDLREHLLQLLGQGH